MVTVLASLVPSRSEALTPPGMALTSQSARFRFYARENRQVDLRPHERALDKVQIALGYELAGPITYYKYDYQEEVASATGHYANGVTYAQSRQIHSVERCHRHEIVHVVASQMGNPGRFIQEGLAVALGDEGKWRGKSASRVAKGLFREKRVPLLGQLVARFENADADVAYPVAGAFTAWLINTEGMAKLRTLFQSCRRAEDLDGAFARTYGETFAEAGQRWQASL